MTRRFVTFDVDNVKLFDALRDSRSSQMALGLRLGQILLDPTTVSAVEKLALGIYGVSVIGYTDRGEDDGDDGGQRPTGAAAAGPGEDREA